MNNKNNKKNLGLVARAQNSLVGKTLRRLMGEETGAVTMEYVVIALLVVAASAVAIWYFGRSVQTAAGEAAQATHADITGAIDTHKDAIEGVKAGNKAGKEAAKEFIEHDKEDEMKAAGED